MHTNNWKILYFYDLSALSSMLHYIQLRSRTPNYVVSYILYDRYNSVIRYSPTSYWSWYSGMHNHSTDFEPKCGDDRDITLRRVQRDHGIISYDYRVAIVRIHLFVLLSLLELAQYTASIVLLLHYMDSNIKISILQWLMVNSSAYTLYYLTHYAQRVLLWPREHRLRLSSVVC